MEMSGLRAREDAEAAARLISGHEFTHNPQPTTHHRPHSSSARLVSGSVKISAAASKKNPEFHASAAPSPLRSAIAPMVKGASALIARPKLYVNPWPAPRTAVGYNSASIAPNKLKYPEPKNPTSGPIASSHSVRNPAIRGIAPYSGTSAAEATT